MEESKAQFELWWLSKEKELRAMGLNFMAISRRRELYLEAWQASRQAVEVNLGKPIYVKHNGDYIHAWPAYNVDIAIRAAGLRIKGE